MIARIAFIGLGEAATAIVSGWGDAKAPFIRAFDVKSLHEDTVQEIKSRAQGLGVTSCASAQDAVDGADVVFSTVTADQAVAAARSCAPFLKKGALWCDLNSCAPHSKQEASDHVEAAGARYLDVAVMAPVYPGKNLVPCLLSGPNAEEAQTELEAMPMSVRVVGDRVGQASSIKLVRSILVKGLEALTTECALAAAAAGVADEVFPSLKDGHPRIDLQERAAYNFERMAVHGARRASEMEECAKMLEHLGLLNVMTSGTAAWQRTIASITLPLKTGPLPNWDWFAERILEDPASGIGSNRDELPDSKLKK